jgi:hypothetical protein
MPRCSATAAWPTSCARKKKPRRKPWSKPPRNKPHKGKAHLFKVPTSTTSRSRADLPAPTRQRPGPGPQADLTPRLTRARVGGRAGLKTIVTADAMINVTTDVRTALKAAQILARTPARPEALPILTAQAQAPAPKTEVSNSRSPHAPLASPCEPQPPQPARRLKTGGCASPSS